MLVLSRKVGEKIVIGDSITVEVVALEQGRVRLGISAPPGVAIHRQEIAEQIKRGVPRPQKTLAG